MNIPHAHLLNLSESVHMLPKLHYVYKSLFIFLFLPLFFLFLSIITAQAQTEKTDDYINITQQIASTLREDGAYSFSVGFAKNTVIFKQIRTSPCAGALLYAKATSIDVSILNFNDVSYGFSEVLNADQVTFYFLDKYAHVGQELNEQMLELLSANDVITENASSERYLGFINKMQKLISTSATTNYVISTRCDGSSSALPLPTGRVSLFVNNGEGGKFASLLEQYYNLGLPPQ